MLIMWVLGFIITFMSYPFDLPPEYFWTCVNHNNACILLKTQILYYSAIFVFIEGHLSSLLLSCMITAQTDRGLY